MLINIKIVYVYIISILLFDITCSLQIPQKVILHVITEIIEYLPLFISSFD